MVGRGDVAGLAVLAALAVLAVHSSHGPRHEVGVLPDPFGRHGNVIVTRGETLAQQEISASTSDLQLKTSVTL